MQRDNIGEAEQLSIGIVGYSQSIAFPGREATTTFISNAFARRATRRPMFP